MMQSLFFLENYFSAERNVVVFTVFLIFFYRSFYLVCQLGLIALQTCQGYGC